jgi:hypothetical protein
MRSAYYFQTNDAGVVGANNAAAVMWRAGSGTERSALMQVGVRAILVGARTKASLSLIDSWEEEAVSALSGLHCKTKLHSAAEADSVLTS